MSDTKHPILSKLTSLGKPRAGLPNLPPASPPAMEGITQAPAPREVQEQLEKGDEAAVPLVGKLPPRKDTIAHIDDLLTEDAKAKGLMPVIEQDETRARELRTGHIQRLANQVPSRVHGEEAVGKAEVIKTKQITLEITPSIKRATVKTGEDVSAGFSVISGQVVAVIDW